MADDIKKKIRELPQEVFYLLTADKAVDLNLVMTENYGLNGMQISAMVDLVERIYVKELRLADLYTQVKLLFTSALLSAGTFDEMKSRQFACDLAGYKFLPITDWLGEDVANYIRSLGGDAAIYATENADLKRLAAADLAADTLAWQEEPDLPPLEVVEDSVDVVETEDDGGRDLTPEESIEQYKNILTADLSDLLTVDDYLFVEEFNARLIGLLINRIEVKDELVAVLLNNEARIGSETIVVDGRQLPPTTGAWISYFISQKGSSLFDAVTLSDFLVNAANTKFLAPSDKAKLSRLLLLYRNLKFFPDSLVGDEPDKWEILTNVGEVNYRVIEQSTPEAYPPGAGKVTDVKSAVDVVEPAVVKSFVVDSAKLNALKALGDKYPAGSLERLAIDEEIKRLTTLK